MKNYRLSLALTDITKEDENIQLFEFDTMDEIAHKIGVFGLKDDRVYLCCIHDGNDSPDSQEIFVSENLRMLRAFIENYDNNTNDFNYPIMVFFQQYESYEDAYAVSLDMKETNKLCYNKK
jgi:hypothetical protein